MKLRTYGYLFATTLALSLLGFPAMVFATGSGSRACSSVGPFSRLNSFVLSTFSIAESNMASQVAHYICAIINFSFVFLVVAMPLGIVFSAIQPNEEG